MAGPSSKEASKSNPAAKPSRYHPALAALHWTAAALILTSLASGKFLLDETPNSSPDKIIQLGVHMNFGIVILLLVATQFVTRLRLPRPVPATAGNALLDLIALVTHYSLYAAVVLMALSGIATAVMADLPGIVFGNSGAKLPETRRARGYHHCPRSAASDRHSLSLPRT